MSKTVMETESGSKKYTFETGLMAQQANGAVMARLGDTMVLVTAVSAKEERLGSDFVPLTVDYQEKMYAAGRIPGGFFKREGKARDFETLSARLIDRSVRPLLYKGWNHDTHIVATVVSADGVHEPNGISLTAASMALTISDIPFQGPIAGLRIARVDGKFIIDPSPEERSKADIDLFVAASKDAIVMVEGGAHEASEAEVVDALMAAHEAALPLCEIQEKMAAAVGKTKRPVPESKTDDVLFATVEAAAKEIIKNAYSIKTKLARYAAVDAGWTTLFDNLVAAQPELADRKEEIHGMYEKLQAEHVRKMIVETGHRIDGRDTHTVRPITCEVGVLPRVHGSALFTRGETQALVTATLGTSADEQKLENLTGEEHKRFMLHYNFPPFSVGEAKPLRGPGRREIGHGALAERALQQVLAFANSEEEAQKFPYTVRVVSDILGSNGSSSQASICGGSLALMDAGVPMADAVAGIAMGLIKQDDKIVILTDILGDEDHLGDMDFKCAGTKKGITAIQMDIKITGITREILTQALEQAREGRLHILGIMNDCISAPRKEMSKYAPRYLTLQINPNKIKDVIGPGGKVIKDIVAKTGCSVDVSEGGLVSIASIDPEKAELALKMVKGVTAEVELGQYYVGKVTSIKDFGAFIEVLPGTDGLCHISELADHRVKDVHDELTEGQEVLVKVIGIDEKSGKIRLSKKEAADKNIDDYRN